MAKTRIQLSDHFTYKRLMEFVLPSIVMMIFTSVYGVVDGLFVSNYAGKAAFAAVNLIMPVPVMLGALGFMLGTGGSAIVAKTLGEGKKGLANQYFDASACRSSGGGWRNAGVLCDLWTYHTDLAALFCSAEYIPEFSCDGRAPVSGVKSDYCGRCDKYGVGFPVCRSAASGSSGSGYCYCHQ